MKNILKRYEILVFIILVFVLSWFPWYTGIEPETATFMPSLIALGMAFLLNGKKAGMDLLRSAGKWKNQSIYWLIAWLGPLLIFIIGLGIYITFWGQSPMVELPSFTVFKQEIHLLPIWLLVVFLPVNGPVGEELGWRGFLLPRLQLHLNPVVASTVIGSLWGIWHLPSFFNEISVQASLGLVFFIPIIIGNISNSIIMTWLYNKTRGSVLVAGIIWHAATDFFAPMFLADFSIAAGAEGAVSVNHVLYAIILGLLTCTAILLSIRTKGRLGYNK